MTTRLGQVRSVTRRGANRSAVPTIAKMPTTTKIQAYRFIASVPGGVQIFRRHCTAEDARESGSPDFVKRFPDDDVRISWARCRGPSMATDLQSTRGLH